MCLIQISFRENVCESSRNGTQLHALHSLLKSERLLYTRFNCSIHTRITCLRCVTVRVNDAQLVMLSEKAHYDHSLSGYLHKRTADSTKWQQRWFVLYQVSELFVMLSKIAHDLLYLHCREKKEREREIRAI